MNKKTIENIKTAAIVVLILVIVFGASYYSSELKEYNNDSSGNTNTVSTDNNSTESSSDDEYDTSAFNSIDIDEYLSLKEGDNLSIIFVARPTCYYCHQQVPILSEVVNEYGIAVNYLDTDELDDEGQAKFIQSDDSFSEGYGTPMILLVKNDKIVDKLSGLTQKDNLVDFFKDNGLIVE
mgnify:CR=1 FL=1